MHISELKKHKEFEHKKNIYPCGECDYNATQPSHLEHHIKFNHDARRVAGKDLFSCDQCDYVAPTKSQVSTTVSFHNGGNVLHDQHHDVIYLLDQH